MDKTHDVDNCERAKKQVQDIMSKLDNLPCESRHLINYEYSNVEKLNKHTQRVPLLVYGNGLLDYSLIDIKHTETIWNSSNGYDILIPGENCEIDV